MRVVAALTFLAPTWLALLAVVAALAIAYVVVQRRRPRPAVVFPNLALLASVVPRSAAWRRHVPAAVALGALAVGAVGMARPAIERHLPRDGVVVLAIDESGSMAATDVSPSRLEAAVAAAQGFVRDAPIDLEIGLVTFTDRATVLVPPTTDRQTMTAALSTLSRGPGTASGEGLFAALDAIESVTADGELNADDTGVPPAAVVLLADGANTVGRSLDDAAAAADERGVPVHTVAFGTDAGTVETGGRTVPVPVETTALNAVASTTGGTFATAASTAQLRDIYDSVGRGVSLATEYRELVPLLTGIALALLLVAVGLGLRWRPRLV